MLQIIRKYVECGYTVELPCQVDLAVSKRFNPNCKFMVYFNTKHTHYYCFIQNGNKLYVRTGLHRLEEHEAELVMSKIAHLVTNFICFHYSNENVWKIARENTEEIRKATSLDSLTREQIYIGLRNRFNLTEQELNLITSTIEPVNSYNYFTVGENVEIEPVLTEFDYELDFANEIQNEYYHFPTENWGL